jgi:S1-C subfamily serine protease
VTSDDEGRYELEGAPRGAFYVRLFHRDYRRRVVLVSGGAGEVDLRVARLDDAGPPGALEVVGPGLSLASTERGIVVQLVAPDGPAARAGVARGELVRSIDGVSADELGLAACTRALWGELGSTVTLVLVGERGERSVALTRDKTLL